MAQRDETALSPEELAVVERFRQQMANPETGPAAVQVQNESLGNLLDGTKIQFRPGPGREPSPALPPAQRWAARERRRIEAKEAAKARAQKGREEPLVMKVEKATKRLQGANVADTIQYIRDLPQQEQEIYLLAEEAGENRVTVLKSFAAVGAKVREKYQSERDVFDELRAN